jgi:hypothetical protein
MKDFSVLRKTGKVMAPPGFEREVLRELAARSRKRVRVRRLRLSLAGAMSLVAVFVVLLNYVLLPRNTGAPVDLSGLEKEMTRDFRPAGLQPGSIAITEPVDYVGDLRSRGQDIPTIYILEQVSTQTDTRIKY